jgi:hypothetical protein
VGILLACVAGAGAQEKPEGPEFRRAGAGRVDEIIRNGTFRGSSVSHAPQFKGHAAAGPVYEVLLVWTFTVKVPVGEKTEFLCTRPCQGGSHTHGQCEQANCSPPTCGPHVRPQLEVKYEVLESATKRAVESAGGSSSEKWKVAGSASVKAGGKVKGVNLGGTAKGSAEKGGETESSTSTEDESSAKSSSTHSGTLIFPERSFGHFAPACSSQTGVVGLKIAPREIELHVRAWFVLPPGMKDLDMADGTNFKPDSSWIKDWEAEAWRDMGPAGFVDTADPSEVFRTGAPKVACHCRPKATLTESPGGSSDDSHGTPSTPGSAPTPSGSKKSTPGAPKAPVAPGEKPSGAPAAGKAATEFGNVGLDPLINFGSIGAGDTFATAITVGSAESADLLRTELTNGGVKVTQNGQAVPFKVISPPQYADAFAPDPDTTVWVETTVLPSAKREVKLGLEQQPADSDGAPTVIGDTTFLAQPRAGIFATPDGVQISVTGTETPWGKQEPKFELHPKNTDPMSPSPNGTDEGGTGSKIVGWLVDTGVSLATVGALYYVGTLLEPEDGGGEGGVPGVRRQGQPAGPTGQGVPTGDGLSPDDAVNGTKSTWTLTGHNSFPTGAQPANGQPAITNVSGMSGVVMDPNFTPTPDAPVVPYLPAFKTGDLITVSLGWDASAGQVPADGAPS